MKSVLKAGLLIIPVLILGIVGSAMATKPTKVSAPSNEKALYFTYDLEDGKTGNQSAGTTVDVRGIPTAIIAVELNAGTVTAITPQASFDAGVTYVDLTDVTASVILPYRQLSADFIRVKIAGCTNCNVDVRYRGLPQ